MNSTMTTEAGTVERLHVDRGVAERLGRWTRTRQFDVRAPSGVLLLDLRTPEIEGDVEILLDLHRSTVKLLLAEDDQVAAGTLAGRAAARSRTTSGPPGRPGAGFT